MPVYARVYMWGMSYYLDSVIKYLRESVLFPLLD